jgi:hypothetical protein
VVKLGLIASIGFKMARNRHPGWRPMGACKGEGRRSRVKNPTRAHHRFEIRKPWTGGGVALK